MQRFQTLPTDADLARLLDPEGRSIHLTADDSAERLVVSPRGYPMWLVWASLSLPILATAAYFAYVVSNRPLLDLERHFLTIAIFAGSGAIAFFFILFRFMNREIIDRGDFFVLDKTQKTLTLPRVSLCISSPHIQEFIEVHAWYSRREASESSHEWLRELSVLVRSETGEFVRYPMITTSGGNVSRWAQYVAEFFGVERRLLKMTWAARRRLKQKQRID